MKKPSSKRTRNTNRSRWPALSRKQHSAAHVTEMWNVYHEIMRAIAALQTRSTRSIRSSFARLATTVRAILASRSPIPVRLSNTLFSVMIIITNPSIYANVQRIVQLRGSITIGSVCFKCTKGMKNGTHVVWQQVHADRSNRQVRGRHQARRPLQEVGRQSQDGRGFRVG